MAEKAYLAIDMGASSGRHVVGLFDGRKLRLEEIYRFENGAVEAAGSLYWDLLGLWSHVRRGLRAAGPPFARAIARKTGPDAASLRSGGVADRGRRAGRGRGRRRL